MSASKTSDGGPAIVGMPLDRVDGRLKVTGQATYSAEWQLKNVAYAYAVQSSIAKGKITKLDTSKAERIPGVLAIFSHLNKPGAVSKSDAANRLQLLQDNQVSYAGQIIAVAVADTLEQAKHAASLVEVSYKPDAFTTDLKTNLKKGMSQDSAKDYKRGNVEKALSQAAVKVDEQYSTPSESHNPMEPFATIAAWDGDALTLYDSTQGVHQTRTTIATILDLPPDKVRVVSHFIGGGFGSKLLVWSHCALAAMSARKVGRPVKLVLDRRQMYGPVGGRPATIQQVALGANKEGKLLAIKHTGSSETSSFYNYVEAFTESAKGLYTCDNVQTALRIVALDIGQPVWMRAPGHATGSFALESALDELAAKLGMDPLELRLVNWSSKDQESGLPWSSNGLRDCYKRGAELFGWNKRKSKPGSSRDGKYLIGHGMATAQHSVWRNPAAAEITLLPDGSAIVRSGTQDIGTGTYTVMTQVAAQSLSLPVEKVRFELGDSNFPKAPVSGGSTTSGSVGGAVATACDAAIKKLIATAINDSKSPLNKMDAKSVKAADGYLFSVDNPATRESFAEIVRRTPEQAVVVTHEHNPGKEEDRFGMSAFGAQFAEVRIDPDLGKVQVSRFVGVFEAGRILNHKTARSQALGGIVFGIGMALMEHTWRDQNLGRIINADIAEYHVPVHPDISNIEIAFIEPEDRHVNPLGVKGIGEVGITGVAAAIANAVYNATGKRIRDLPITLDKLI